MSLLVLAARDVDAVVAGMKAEELEALMAGVLRGVSMDCGCEMPHRSSVSMPRHTALFMPCRARGIGTAIKVVCVPTTADDENGLQASTVLLDETTGRVKAMIDANALTALRTAAGTRTSYSLLTTTMTTTTTG